MLQSLVKFLTLSTLLLLVSVATFVTLIEDFFIEQGVCQPQATMHASDFLKSLSCGYVHNYILIISVMYIGSGKFPTFVCGNSFCSGPKVIIFHSLAFCNT